MTVTGRFASLPASSPAEVIVLACRTTDGYEIASYHAASMRSRVR